MQIPKKWNVVDYCIRQSNLLGHTETSCQGYICEITIEDYLGKPWAIIDGNPDNGIDMIDDDGMSVGIKAEVHIPDNMPVEQIHYNIYNVTKDQADYYWLCHSSPNSKYVYLDGWIDKQELMQLGTYQPKGTKSGKIKLKDDCYTITGGLIHPFLIE